MSGSTPYSEEWRDVPVVEKPKIEVDMWVIDPESEILLFITKKDEKYLYGYGFNREGEFIVGESAWMHKWQDNKDLRPAEDQEVKDRLIEEAKKRGLVYGAKIVNNVFPEWSPTNKIHEDNYNFYDEGDLFELNVGGVLVFRKGKWVELVKEKFVHVYSHGSGFFTQIVDDPAISKKSELEIISGMKYEGVFKLVKV